MTPFLTVSFKNRNHSHIYIQQLDVGEAVEETETCFRHRAGGKEPNPRQKAPGPTEDNEERGGGQICESSGDGKPKAWTKWGNRAETVNMGRYMEVHTFPPCSENTLG